jgi:hypothetical protein
MLVTAPCVGGGVWAVADQTGPKYGIYRHPWSQGLTRLSSSW